MRLPVCLLWAVAVLVSTTHAETLRNPFVLRQSTATGTSNAFNPAISVNGLFLGFHTSSPFELEPAFGHHEEEEHHEEEGDAHAHGLPVEGGLSVQEIEIRLTSNVDTYLRGDLILAMPGAEGIELEEGFVETISLPNVSFRIGKFLSAFGKHNRLHTHAYPYIDPPIAQQRILGPEGLNEVGIRASLLVPVGWFSELNIEVLDGLNELFNAPDSEDFVYVVGSKNLWDVTDAATLEIGGAMAAGINESGNRTDLAGANVTWKWQADGPGRRGFTLETEYLWGRVDDGIDRTSAGGLSASLQVQTSSRWWLQSRYDGFDDHDSDPRQHRFTGLVAFVPSEFSAFRVAYSMTSQGDERVHQVMAQLNFTMGAHPAHAY